MLCFVLASYSYDFVSSVLAAHRRIRKGGRAFLCPSYGRRANLTDFALQSLILLPTYCVLHSSGNNNKNWSEVVTIVVCPYFTDAAERRKGRNF
jgi:hypothetical protein